MKELDSAIMYPLIGMALYSVDNQYFLLFKDGRTIDLSKTDEYQIDDDKNIIYKAEKYSGFNMFSSFPSKSLEYLKNILKHFSESYDAVHYLWEGLNPTDDENTRMGCIMTAEQLLKANIERGEFIMDEVQKMDLNGRGNMLKSSLELATKNSCNNVAKIYYLLR